MTSPAQCADGQQPPASPPRARTVSFEGMATGTRLDDVREVASHFGAIELLHTDGQGHGFVRFAHASAAQEFYDTLHGMDRLVSLVPDSVAPQCTSLNPEAGSTVLAPASSAASSPRAVARSLDEPPHANGQSAECGGDAGTTPRLHRDPGRLPSLLPVHIYNTSLGCTLNDIHSRLCKYGTIDDIRMLPRGAGFLVDFLAPVAAANCVAMYRLQDRDCACWASASVLRQAPTPRSQWRRSGGVPTTTATPRPAPDLPQPPLGPRQPQPPLGPRQSQPPQGPRQRSPSGRRVPAVTDEPAPGPGGAGGMSYDTRLRQAQASVLFTAIRPRMSARDVVSMLGGFGPIQAVTVVPGKTEAVITFVSQGSATRCLRSFHHRSHTVQHVSLALYLLCHPDSLQERIGFASQGDANDASIAPHSPPPPRSDVIAARDGGGGSEDTRTAAAPPQRRESEQSDKNPVRAARPSPMTARIGGTSGCGRPQEGAESSEGQTGINGGPRGIPEARAGGSCGGGGEDVSQKLKALQAQNAEWRRRAEVAEAREDFLVAQLTGLKSVVVESVDRLVMDLAAMDGR